MRKVLNWGIIVLVLMLGGCLNNSSSNNSNTTNYTVSFESNGGTSITAISVTSGGKITQPASPTKAGYTFSGWYKEVGLLNAWNFNVDTVTGNMTLYAKWTSLNYILVQGGTFTMGNTLGGGNSNETPTHSVTLTNNYYMSKFEVTQTEFNSVMGFNPSYFTGSVGNNPVEQVTWYDAVMYCNKLSINEGLTPYYDITGITYSGTAGASKITAATVTQSAVSGSDKGYRLPTEAEWEYAAKGGKNASNPYKTYSGSDTVGDVAWYYDNSTATNVSNPDTSRGTNPVGGKQANELGIYDMSGNVWEWCYDWYGSYTSNSVTNPTGATSGSSRVRRGGGWGNSANFVRSAYRYYDIPVYSATRLGFRPVRTE